MSRLRVCFEIVGLAEDEYGEPCPAGMQVDFGECMKNVPYADLVKSISIPAMLEVACLGHIPASNVRVITPEEYDEKYGDA